MMMQFKSQCLMVFVCVLEIIVTCVNAKNHHVPEGEANTVQQARIVFIRHGEKPLNGLGQLNCKGLNRALALPEVLISRFGKPHIIYAPNPGYLKPDQGGVLYNYIRPLATIEPTAIRLELPVNTRYGFDQIKLFENELLNDIKKNRHIWIAWEHKEIVNIERALFKALGVHPDIAVAWDRNEFDRIDVIDIDYQKGNNIVHVHYKKQNQGLNYLSTQCPGNAL